MRKSEGVRGRGPSQDGGGMLTFKRMNGYTSTTHDVVSHLFSDDGRDRVVHEELILI